MEHKNAERHSGKVYRLFELLGHTEGQLYIAEIAVLITLLIGTAVYILLLRVLCRIPRGLRGVRYAGLQG